MFEQHTLGHFQKQQETDCRDIKTHLGGNK